MVGSTQKKPEKVHADYFMIMLTEAEFQFPRLKPLSFCHPPAAVVVVTAEHV